MLYGVKINGIDTLAEYGLALASDYSIEAPTMKETRVDIPGADGSINLSYALTGRPTFNDRNISFSLFRSTHDSDLVRLRSKLMSQFHGREVQLVFPFDGSVYYSGILQIGNITNYNSSVIPVSMTASPYRIERVTSVEDWLWDPFDLNTGIARHYVDLPIETPTEYFIVGSDMPVSPVFDVDGEGIGLYFHDEFYNLPEGRSSVIGLTLDPGMNSIIFTGEGTVSIEFRGGWL